MTQYSHGPSHQPEPAGGDLGKLPPAPHILTAERQLKKLVKFVIASEIPARALEKYRGSLAHTDPEELSSLLAGVKNIVANVTANLPYRKPPSEAFFALLNTVEFLQRTAVEKDAEKMFEALIPIARACSDDYTTCRLFNQVGCVYQNAREFPMAASFYTEAIAIGEKSRIQNSLILMVAYNYFLERSMCAMHDEPYTASHVDDTARWVGRVLAVLDHPVNKNTASQTDPSALRGLELVCIASLQLERQGRETNSGSEKLHLRLAHNAAASKNFRSLPFALVRLSEFYLGRGDFGEAIAQRIKAHEMLRRDPDDDSQEFLRHDFAKLMKLIARRDPDESNGIGDTDSVPK